MHTVRAGTDWIAILLPVFGLAWPPGRKTATPFIAGRARELTEPGGALN